jgi:hypothetical protein
VERVVLNALATHCGFAADHLRLRRSICHRLRIFFVGYKVTGPTAGLWHYEYAIFNMNLDRGIQSFSIFFGFPVGESNIEFHAPPQHPGWPNDGTVGDAGYSNAPWTFDPGNGTAATWSSETIAQNPNANAIRWGTLYNFRFDSSAPPVPSTATINFFKKGSPVSVDVAAPSFQT